MSKYDKLWSYIGALDGASALLSYEDVERIAGASIDHSFLTYKKELTAYGWEVEKISMKQQTVKFRKL